MQVLKKNILTVAIILISQNMLAQLYFGTQTGIANIQSNVAGTMASYRMGGAIKAGYIHRFSKYLGIGSGIEFAQYRQEVSLQNPQQSFVNSEIDQTNSAFIYKVKTTNYLEVQTLTALQIPIFLEYRKAIEKGVQFNFRAGGKYFLPLKYAIKASANTVSGTGFYPNLNLEIDNLPKYGFGSQTNYFAKGEYETKGVLMSMFELGFTFDVSPKNSLYAAMYLESSYNSIINQDQDKSYIGYNPNSAQDRQPNGLYSTNRYAEVKPVAFGLTLGWNFK